jgi:hypothetical protein
MLSINIYDSGDNLLYKIINIKNIKYNKDRKTINFTCKDNSTLIYNITDGDYFEILEK